MATKKPQDLRLEAFDFVEVAGAGLEPHPPLGGYESGELPTTTSILPAKKAFRLTTKGF